MVCSRKQAHALNDEFILRVGGTLHSRFPGFLSSQTARSVLCFVKGKGSNGWFCSGVELLLAIASLFFAGWRVLMKCMGVISIFMRMKATSGGKTRMSSVKRFGYRDKELHLLCKGGFLEGANSERLLFLTIPFRVVEVLPY